MIVSAEYLRDECEESRILRKQMEIGMISLRWGQCVEKLWNDFGVSVLLPSSRLERKLVTYRCSFKDGVNLISDHVLGWTQVRYHA